MKPSLITAAGMLSTILLLAACDRNENPAESVVEGTKDALDMRDHEKLKDAGEDAQDAFDNAVEGVKDETGAN